MSKMVKGHRAPSLERLLRDTSRSDLSEFYSFWDGHAPTPRTSDGLVDFLVGRMTDEESVRKRLKFLSKKLVDLLKFLLRDPAYTVSRQSVLESRLFNYMSQYEVEAALNALQKRGLIFQAGEQKKNGGITFAVPADLGDVLHAFLWDEECSLQEMFSLRSWVKRLGPAELDRFGASVSGDTELEDVERAAHVLSSSAEVARRIKSLDPQNQEFLRIVIEDGGGFITKAQYGRIKTKRPRWERTRIKRMLEGAYLGTLRHLALGEYGINHFDDTVVIFEEVVATYRRDVAADPAQHVDDIRTCGVDLISDISNFLSFVAHNRVRLTLGGQIYRTVSRKLSEQMILSQKPEFVGLDPFQYIYDFCVSHRLVERRPDRTLHITVKGRKWEKDDLDKKVKVLLSFAFQESLQSGDEFHAPMLRERLLEVLGTQQVGSFFGVLTLPCAARNIYLSHLEVDHIRDSFQNRYQYAPSAVMRDAAGLAQSLFQWMRDRLYLLGLVDLGLEKDTPVVARLTALGARALGRSLPADLEAAGRPLIVNPDFEVLLFPDEGDTYDLITRLDRFAERQSSDAVYRYKVTDISVEKAVADGLEVSEILRALSENARGAIPQNVVYSIKEWAAKVQFVTARAVTVLRGRNREIMDRVLRTLSSRGVGCERLSPTAILVDEKADLAAIESELLREGVFLEGSTPSKNGHPVQPDQPKPPDPE